MVELIICVGWWRWRLVVRLLVFGRSEGLNGRKNLLVVLVLRFLHLSHGIDHGIKGKLLELLLVLLKLLLQYVHIGNGVQKSFGGE